MSPHEQHRLTILQQVLDKAITQRRAARDLALSVRQVRRLTGKLKGYGPSALISTRRGRMPNNRCPADVRALVVERALGIYAGFGPAFIAETLAHDADLVVSRETIRTILIAAGIWKPKVRKRHLHPLRERRSCFGELVQADGSPHAWFEDRGPYCTLLLAIDDATSRINGARFEPAETTDGYFTLFRNYCIQHGRPVTAYTDRHSIFRSNDPQVTDDEPTQFGAALEKLDIKLICANSPQAKGRVERANRTLQDRLVKTFRLLNINTIEAGNAYLPTYLPEHNARYAVEPANPQDVHRSIDGYDLNAIFVHTETRILTKNLLIQFENRIYAVEGPNAKRLRRGMRITISRAQDGTLTMATHDRQVDFRQVGEQRRKAPIVGSKELNAPINRTIPNPKKGHTPQRNHPWRTPFPTPRPASADISALREADIIALR